MSKKSFVSMRVDSEEIADLKRQAAALGMPLSRFLRAAVFSFGKQESQQAAAKTDDSELSKELAEMREEIEDLRVTFLQSSRALETLLSQISEIVRVPSFAEFRSRVTAEGLMRQRENEDINAYLLRVAKRYFMQYRYWPKPADGYVFGSKPQGFDLQKWPAQPPRD